MSVSFINIPQCKKKGAKTAGEMASALRGSHPITETRNAVGREGLEKIKITFEEFSVL